MRKRAHDMRSRMRESASTDLREPQGSNPLGPPGRELTHPSEGQAGMRECERRRFWVRSCRSVGLAGENASHPGSAGHLAIASRWLRRRSKTYPAEDGTTSHDGLLTFSDHRWADSG